MALVKLRCLTAALLSGAVVAGCFVQERTDDELRGLFWSVSDVPCRSDGDCSVAAPCALGWCIKFEGADALAGFCAGSNLV